MDIVKKLKEIRKEIWDDLHNSQEWAKKDKIISLLDEAIKELKK